MEGGANEENAGRFGRAVWDGDGTQFFYLTGRTRLMFTRVGLLRGFAASSNVVYVQSEHEDYLGPLDFPGFQARSKDKRSRGGRWSWTFNLDQKRS